MAREEDLMIMCQCLLYDHREMFRVMEHVYRPKQNYMNFDFTITIKIYLVVSSYIHIINRASFSNTQYTVFIRTQFT